MQLVSVLRNTALDLLIIVRSRHACDGCVYIKLDDFNMALCRKGYDLNAPSFHFLFFFFFWEAYSSQRWRTYFSMSWILLVLLIHPSLTYNPTSCLSIQASCVQRRGCASALHHYLLSCAYLITGQTSDQCSVRCQRALVTLISATTEDHSTQPSTEHSALVTPHHGWSSSSSIPPTQHHHLGWSMPSFMSCTCGENTVCRSQRARLDCCLDGVARALRAVDDKESSVPCSLAEQICRADTSCLTAIEFYGRNCGYLLQTSGGGRCLSRCRNSVRVLYRQRQALKLRSCHCDGTEEYDCRMLQSRTQQLCVDGERFSRGSTKRLPPRQRFKQQHQNSTTSRRPPPSLTSRAIPIPPRKYKDSVNSGSSGISGRIEALICSVILIYAAVGLAYLQSGTLLR